MTICIVGNSSETALEQSYKRALEALGHAVSIYDIEKRAGDFVRFGRLGLVFNQYITVEAWRQKMNRDLALSLRTAQPDLVLVVGNARITFSTLAFVKSVHACLFVLLWPDPLTSLQSHVRESAALYDCVATYSQASVPMFRQLGFTNPHWVPLAADPSLHGYQPTGDEFRYDFSFVGDWRPERERALAVLATQFSGRKLGIWGTNWQRSKSPALKPHLHLTPLRGRDCARLFGQSRLNLNLIDATGYPAANMRFFEILIARGLQVVSACPEMADTFLPDEHALYFDTDESLCVVVDNALRTPTLMADIRQRGYERVQQGHTYLHRAEQLLSLLF
ncbi:glycosyltransferase [Fibrella sp. USSR17]